MEITFYTKQSPGRKLAHVAQEGDDFDGSLSLREALEFADVELGDSSEVRLNSEIVSLSHSVADGDYFIVTDRTKGA